MKRVEWPHEMIRGGLVLLASVAPLAFPLSQMGYSSLHTLGELFVLPAALILLLLFAALRAVGVPGLGTLAARGCLAGVVATGALELVRYTGFRLGSMPGNLPELMGVLLLDRFALGPSRISTMAGFAYHFWTGGCFGVIFVLLARNRPRWWAIPYGLAVAIGFLVSPVVQALGVGLFGKDFRWHFAATVLLAHAAFGTALASLLPRRPGPEPC